MPHARMSAVAYVGMGSNLADSRRLLGTARGRLDTIGRVTAWSALYRTAPVGPPQPAYLNAVVAMECRMCPRTMVARLLEIERGLGRIRTAVWGPRTMDLDLLWVPGVTLDHPEARVPHPRIHERAFVLGPWRELAPDLRPWGRQRIEDLWRGLTHEVRADVHRTGDRW